MRGRPLVLAILSCLLSMSAWAGGGPLGIDHRLALDDSGIWSRGNQNLVMYGLAALDVGGALWLGKDDRLGKTFAYSLDSLALGGVASLVMKKAFGRLRPNQTDDPNKWFKGGNESFPSGEVTAISAIVTPFILEYGREHPLVYGLEILPLYQAVARMKSRAHWQSDVLAGFALGSVAGYLAHRRDSPLLMSILPDGMSLGFERRF
jgi:membrane-associated phospholipid phosphatase